MSQPEEFRQPVVVGGVMAAISAVIYLTGSVIPTLQELFGALPMAICAMMIPVPYAMISAAAAGILIGIFLGPMTGMAFICEYALMGIYTGWGAHEGKRWFTLFVGATLFASVGTLLMMVARFAIMGFDINAFLATFTNLRDEMLNTVQSSGLFERMANEQESAEILEATFKQITQFVMEITPSFYLVILAVLAMIHLWLLKWLSDRLRMPVAYILPSVDGFRAPGWVLVPFFLAWIGILVYNRIAFYPLWLIAINVMVICIATFAAGGFSWIFRAVGWYQRPVAMRVLVLVALLVTFQYVVIGAVVIGVVDTIIKSRHKPAQE